MLTTVLLFTQLAMATDPAERIYLVSFEAPAVLEQDAILVAAFGKGKSSKQPIFRYTLTQNGVAMRLTDVQAQQLANTPGVAAVEPDGYSELQTDAGPGFIGADQVWNQTGNRGAGVVIGVIDTGINAEHPSFAATAADGYVHQNPRGVRFGLCNGFAGTRCNDKLIGIYDFTTEGAVDGSDIDGHGTHVASIAAGNPIGNSVSGQTISVPITLSGVAPRANIISYKACAKLAVPGARTTCPSSSLIAAVEQAAIDRVPVINYSLGGDVLDPWALMLSAASSDIKSMLNARAGGTVFSVAAGNSGPGVSSLGSPANAPWVLGVANTTHDRLLATELRIVGASTPIPAINLLGAGITAGVDNRPIVLGERFGSTSCGSGPDAELPPTGTSNPFAPGTFNGEIVVCDRGLQSRVAKGFNVRQSGAGGMILLNTVLEGESIISDDHFLPTVHLGVEAGSALKAWLRSAQNPRGSISAAASMRDARFGDLLANSSSRGPVAANVIKPDVSAPGSSIIAADLATGATTKTGTSMAAPHVAGTLALIKAAHPNWNPAQLESAIRTTTLATRARAAINAPPLGIPDASAGRVQVQNAINAPLNFPLTSNDFRIAGFANATQVNLPSMYSPRCFRSCSFQRTVQSNETLGVGVWNASVEGAEGLSAVITPAQFSLANNQSQTLSIRFDVAHEKLIGQTVSAYVRLQAAGKPIVRMPVVLTVVATQAGNAPEELIRLAANSARGSMRVPFSGFQNLPKADARIAAFAPFVEEQAVSIGDSTPDDLYDANSTLTRLFNLSDANSYIWATATVGVPATFAVGRDADGNGRPSAGEELCVVPQTVSTKQCKVFNLSAGRYWVAVQNRASVGFRDNVQLRYVGATTQNVTNAYAYTQGLVPASESFAVTLGYDLSEFPARSVAALLDLYADPDTSSPMQRTLVVLDSSVASADEPTLLQTTAPIRVHLTANEMREQIGFDVPKSATAIELDVITDGSAVIEWIPANAVVASLGPPIATPVRTDNVQGSAKLRMEPGSSIGRWNLRVRSTSNLASNVQLKLTVIESSNAVPTIAPEIYYNPSRPGHGLFVTRAGNDAQIMWYTYDDQNQPTWYWMFPNGFYQNTSGVAVTTINRYAFDGSKVVGRGNVVGTASFTRIDNDTFYFGFNIMGKATSEIMRRLNVSKCTAGFDSTGAWYQPATSGWGGSLHSTPSLEFQGFFIYDDRGNPRWVLGQADSPSNGQTVQLYQHIGFCPTCAFQPDTRRPVGSYQFNVTQPGVDPMRASVGLNVNFLSPLSGSFLRSGDFARLTGARACQQ
jgi:subtilisin family serine protease